MAHAVSVLFPSKPELFVFLVLAMFCARVDLLSHRVDVFLCLIR